MVSELPLVCAAAKMQILLAQRQKFIMTIKKCD